MPAGKTKTANGSATPSKAVSRSGTATPVSAIASQDLASATLTGGKPDKKAYDAEQESIKAELDSLHAKLGAVRDKIGLATRSGPSNDRRNDLRSQLDGFKGQQSVTKNSRTKIFEQIKTKQEGIQNKIKALQNAKSKTPFKTVAEVDAHIQNLEKQVESGNMKLADEKRALAEISSTRRSRRAVESFQADQDAIEADRAEIEELKKQLDDPEAKAIAEQYETIKAELDSLRLEGDKAAAERNQLFTERDSLQAQIKEWSSKKHESYQRFKEHNDRYWAKVNEDRARRAERARAEKIAYEKEKKKELADRLLEEAQTPAFQYHVEDCQTLIDYFSGKSTTQTFKSVETTEAKELPGVPKLEVRKVEDIPEGSIVRKKKGEEEEAYFVAGKKAKGGKKGGAAKAAPSPGADAPSTPTSSSSLNVPLATLSALLSMSIPPPTSSADVPRVIEDLKTKKAWYEANQDRVTKENIAKAEREIQRLTGADSKSAVETPAEPSSPAPEEAAQEDVPASEEAATKEDS
ncbi:nuclear segregation protein Bfr1 [Coprinopsis sp. MPI-PUGE-AT-0042]|nr:nuclear segregation protein Bfr1 [Coprinopsis sp. MPI-PUGE-AT-0042]